MAKWDEFKATLGTGERIKQEQIEDIRLATKTFCEFSAFVQVEFGDMKHFARVASAYLRANGAIQCE